MWTSGNGGRAGWRKCFAREPCHHDGVLATGEEQRGILELGGSFPQNENRFGFQLIEVTELVVWHGEVV